MEIIQTNITGRYVDNLTRYNRATQAQNPAFPNVTTLAECVKTGSRLRELRNVMNHKLPTAVQLHVDIRKQLRGIEELSLVLQDRTAMAGHHRRFSKNFDHHAIVRERFEMQVLRQYIRDETCDLLSGSPHAIQESSLARIRSSALAFGLNRLIEFRQPSILLAWHLRLHGLVALALAEHRTQHKQKSARRQPPGRHTIH